MFELSQYSQVRPVVVVGAAFCDVMLGVDTLPESGGDVTAQDLGSQVGGCAFNVIRVLQRLSLEPVNAIPVGNGVHGRTVAAAMEKENLPVSLLHPTHDNGWCIAMVEANRERTFVSIEGCEQHWNEPLLAQIPVPDQAIIYVSGYELVSDGSEALRDWLLAQSDDKTLFVDLGPRIRDIDPVFINKLLEKKPILTLNRDELRALEMPNDSQGSLLTSAIEFSNNCDITLICRFDKEGATVCQPGMPPVTVEALKVEVADTIAAGDSHTGGVIAGIALGMPVTRAVELGNLIAGIVVSKPGSNGAPTLSELVDFQKSMTVVQSD
ncbi:PfkB family carbohydrate kinase [Endozoicomonas numazuensis]|uniref:Ribokinase n=1 Tax=Endozoicomonas numazuensis TaxID=1137799 RepID=A0A081NF94_9GAMM|nr:PfkB family carbohydrate kinase [Endozoicomonas numazuensis]KEQ17117.1 ribokinase [Endozoicomonas numazuensis]